MLPEDILVGETVFIFSESLNEIIKGSVEGFNLDKTRVKVLQETSDGLIRHIVSWVYVSKDFSSIEAIASEYRSNNAKLSRYMKGMTVHLRQLGELVTDREGFPYVYQIIKVYQDSQRVSLVNAQGETVGTFSVSELEFCSNDPIFKSSDYYVGQNVTWIESEDVYEGTITHIRENTAEISFIKKLMPLDYKKNLPYYKIQSDDLENNQILTSIVGDTIDSD